MSLLLLLVLAQAAPHLAAERVSELPGISNVGKVGPGFYRGWRDLLRFVDGFAPRAALFLPTGLTSR